MGRLVRHERQGPYIIKEGDKTIAICACGLSKNLPYCDGHHKRVKDEAEGEVYLYDDEGNRICLPKRFVA